MDDRPHLRRPRRTSQRRPETRTTLPTQHDELGYLPFPVSGGQTLFHLISRLYERTSIVLSTNLASRMAQRLGRAEDLMMPLSSIDWGSRLDA